MNKRFSYIFREHITCVVSSCSARLLTSVFLISSEASKRTSKRSLLAPKPTGWPGSGALVGGTAGRSLWVMGQRHRFVRERVAQVEINGLDWRGLGGEQHVAPGGFHVQPVRVVFQQAVHTVERPCSGIGSRPRGVVSTRTGAGSSATLTIGVVRSRGGAPRADGGGAGNGVEQQQVVKRGQVEALQHRIAMPEQQAVEQGQNGLSLQIAPSRPAHRRRPAAAPGRLKEANSGTSALKCRWNCARRSLKSSTRLSERYRRSSSR